MSFKLELELLEDSVLTHLWICLAVPDTLNVAYKFADLIN